VVRVVSRDGGGSLGWGFLPLGFLSWVIVGSDEEGSKSEMFEVVDGA
jgi:hypothetical protein